jgi:hypothetical protein
MRCRPRSEPFRAMSHTPPLSVCRHGKPATPTDLAPERKVGLRVGAIQGLWPSSEYAPRSIRFPACKPATIKRWVGRAHQPPGISSSRGSGFRAGAPLAASRTIAMISCTISPRAPPAAPLSKYSTAARISAFASSNSNRVRLTSQHRGANASAAKRER